MHVKGRFHRVSLWKDGGNAWVHQRHAGHWFTLVTKKNKKKNWPDEIMYSSLIIVIWRGVKSKLAKILLTHWSIDRLEPDLSLSWNNQPLLHLYSTVRPHNGVVMSKHNAQYSEEMHHLSEWLPQHSCHPPPAHIQPSHAQLYFLDWECGKPRAMKGWIVPWMAHAV